MWKNIYYIGYMQNLYNFITCFLPVTHSESTLTVLHRSKKRKEQTPENGFVQLEKRYHKNIVALIFTFPLQQTKGSLNRNVCWTLIERKQNGKSILCV